MTYGFERSRHLRRQREFEHVYHTGRRATGRFMTLIAAPSAFRCSRLGISASRKLGPAVARNRAKRRVRELFRHHRFDRALDVVVIPRRELIDAEYPLLEREFRGLLRPKPADRNANRRSG